MGKRRVARGAVEHGLRFGFVEPAPNPPVVPMPVPVPAETVSTDPMTLAAAWRAFEGHARDTCRACDYTKGLANGAGDGLCPQGLTLWQAYSALRPTTFEYRRTT